MKKTLAIGALAAVGAMMLPVAAEAQSWGRDHDRDGRYERWERRSDRDRHDGGRYTHRERERDWRRYERDQRRDYRRDYRRDSRWHRGATIPYQYRNSWYVRDYNRYGYAPPPRGYGYYRTDTGDVVLALVATGVILSLLD